MERLRGMVTHILVTEAHSAGFSFAKEKETAVGLNEGGAGAIFSSAADFTGILRFCKHKTSFTQQHLNCF